MDYSSIDSELIESLDFLRPPVKRVLKTTNRSTIIHQESHVNNKNIKVLKDIRRQIFKDCHLPQPKGRGTESSASLILKKTTERDIIRQNSVLSYSNLLGPHFQTSKKLPDHSPAPKEKPLIKVTVIPKLGRTQPSNVLKKRKHPRNRIHSTVSDQGSSIKTKNVFLVVKGRKREKVYEIKTTGSAEFTNTRSKNYFKDEVTPIGQFSSLQLVLDSLNMDRERDRDRRRRKHEDLVEFTSVVNGFDSHRDCLCWNTARENENNRECACMGEVQGGPSTVVDTKSRVRITGRLGLTEDDRYVLRCNATVDDKPIEAEYTEFAQTVSPSTYRETPERNYNKECNRDSCMPRCYNAATYCTQKRDFNIQVDVQNENKYEMAPPARIMQCKESQATQVNFNVGWCPSYRYKNQFTNKDELIQCCRVTDVRTTVSDSDSDSNTAKGCQNPLVIISVYPAQAAQDCCENLTVVKTYQDDSKRVSPQKPNVSGHNSRSKTRQNNEKKTDSKAPSRSRSPSPQNKKMEKHNVAETRVLRTTTRKSSPGREVAQTPYDTNRLNRITPDKTNKTNYTTSYRQHYGTSQTKKPKSSKGMNTDHNITKKILVDSYTKELTNFLKSENDATKFRFPKSDPSRVTVNIDGDNEYYNVLFQQANSTTDLKVRKTVKSPNNKKLAENAKRTTPTSRSPPSRDEPKRKSSPVQSKNQHKDGYKLSPTFSRLQVKDSIEISHRRDYKIPVDHTVKHSQNTKNNYNDSDQFSAPIKHYRGDSCPIPDPIKRDKEIRALLGVDKGVYTSTSPGFKVEEKKFAVPLRYLYGKTEKKIVTGINMMEMQDPPCACCDVAKFYSGHSFKIQEQTSCPDQIRAHDCHTKCTPSVCSRKCSHHDKKISVNPAQINKKTAQQEPTTSDSTSPDEKSPSQMVESPSQEEDSPNQMEDSPTADEEAPDPAVDKKLANRMSSKSILRKPKANKNSGTQYETQVRQTSLYQQLILNRNIQVFLQIEQFTKTKPIILSRKQYDKVKRTIQSTIESKTGRDPKRKKCICKTSVASVGDVRKKRLRQPSPNDKPILPKKKESVKSKHSSSASNKSESSTRQKNNAYVLFAKQETTRYRDKGTVVTPRLESVVLPGHAVLKSPKLARSSMEIQFASTSYMKRVSFSSTNVKAGSTCPPPLSPQESHSIHTIFKGHRRCPTPNLGTSVYSLYSEDNNAMVSPKPLLMESKQKKPFLRRLMSCLVMRMARASEPHNITAPPVEAPSCNSSIDSYHISTSLGEIEVSSSIYDTSASFYSNHSIYPVNSKTKRGFFSSVREFLSIRKS